MKDKPIYDGHAVRAGASALKKARRWRRLRRWWRTVLRWGRGEVAA
jgi:hypothetical protein